MHHIKLGALIAGLGVISTRIKAFLAYIGHKWTQIEPIALPLIEEVEQMAAKGVINKADRKTLVMAGLKLAQEKGLFKLNLIEKMLLPMAVDRIAESLPDIQVSQQAEELINIVLNKIKDQKQNSTQPT